MRKKARFMSLVLIFLTFLPWWKFTLHPLIHTMPPGTSAQNVVAWSLDEECGLKYVIYTSKNKCGL